MTAEERAAVIVSHYRPVGIIHGWHLDRIAEAIAAAIREAEREAAERMRERAALTADNFEDHGFEEPGLRVCIERALERAADAIRDLPLEETP